MTRDDKKERKEIKERKLKRKALPLTSSLLYPSLFRLVFQMTSPKNLGDIARECPEALRKTVQRSSRFSLKRISKPAQDRIVYTDGEACFVTKDQFEWLLLLLLLLLPLSDRLQRSEDYVTI